MTTKSQAAAWLRSYANTVLPPDQRAMLATAANLLDPPPRVPDQRTKQRLIRIRLYQRGAEEPDADSEMQGNHPAPPDAAGTWPVKGLPESAMALASIAATFHTGAAISGLDRATLMHRIKSLRPTLSRRGGTAVWRVPYTVNEDNWDARVDVVNA